MIDHHRPSMIWELYMQRLQDSQTVSHHRRRFWTPSKWYQTYWNTLTNLHLWKPFSIQGRLWETCRRSISVQICRAWSLHHGFEYLWIRAPYIILTVSDHSPALDWPDSHGWRNSGKFWSATSLSLCSLMHFYAFFLSDQGPKTSCCISPLYSSSLLLSCLKEPDAVCLTSLGVPCCRFERCLKFFNRTSRFLGQEW